MSEKRVIEITKIEEKEFSCSTKNLTMLKINKDWLSGALEQNHIEVVLKHLSSKIFNSEFFYEKQKVVALKNLVKDVKKALSEEDAYKLNLVIRNLNAFQAQEKSDVTLLKVKRLEVINSMIAIPYNLAFHNILKNMYKVENTTKK